MRTFQIIQISSLKQQRFTNILNHSAFSLKRQRFTNTLNHSVFLKRQRFTKVLNDIKRQMVQSSILKKIEFFFTASTKCLKFVYARVVTEKKKKVWNIFDNLRSINWRNEENEAWFFLKKKGVRYTQRSYITINQLANIVHSDRLIN